MFRARSVTRRARLRGAGSLFESDVVFRFRAPTFDPDAGFPFGADFDFLCAGVLESRNVEVEDDAGVGLPRTPRIAESTSLRVDFLDIIADSRFVELRRMDCNCSPVSQRNCV